MNVSIVGAGYVGLVTGACLADSGHRVVLVDVDRSKVDAINRAEPPIHEAGLGDLLQRHVGIRLRATTDLHAAVAETDLTLIAVGTPLRNAQIDLTFVSEAASQIGRAIRDKADYHVIVVKSTVVPGTTDQIVGADVSRESGKTVGDGFGLGMNPEFLTEGQAVADFQQPDRIVLGGCNERTWNAIEDLYRSFTDCPHIRVGNRAAEMIKYASNSLLATMISFANEIGNLCAAIGDIDVVDVMRGAHASHYLSPRVADGKRVTAPIASFLQAGCGFGGSCLPKDVQALVSHGINHGLEMPLLDAVLRVNRSQPQRIISLLKKHFASLSGVRTAVLGLAFKPDTDDVRESPAFPIIDALLTEGALIKAYDPVAGPQARRIFSKRPIAVCEELCDTLTGTDAVVLVTKWDEFRAVPDLLRDISPQPVFIDGRRLIDKHSVSRYEGIGL